MAARPKSQKLVAATTPKQVLLWANSWQQSLAVYAIRPSLVCHLAKPGICHPAKPGICHPAKPGICHPAKPLWHCNGRQQHRLSPQCSNRQRLVTQCERRLVGTNLKCGCEMQQVVPYIAGRLDTSKGLKNK